VVVVVGSDLRGAAERACDGRARFVEVVSHARRLSRGKWLASSPCAEGASEDGVHTAPVYE